jgi:nucleoside 2-deoxyribosyltransferase
VNQFHRVFLSAPLAAFVGEPNTEIRFFYNNLAQVCKKHGLEVYEPYIYTDPQTHDHLRADKVYADNKEHLTACDLVIAYVGVVSAGVSMEIEFANAINIPVIILYETNPRDVVSRMILGCPVVKDAIVAPDFQQLANKLNEKLSGILQRLESEFAPTANPQFVELLKRTHDRSTLSLGYVGRAASLDKGYLSRLLVGKITRPAREQIIRLCVWGWKLGLEETNLILRTGGYSTL